ncbi:imm11 family protein [Capnocytophaga canimorsus]|uniref:imm11 family protein n=1 Tax=Capnocytophaga canimorsus TaxID=28188 RepID=UPI00385B2BE0
MYFEFSDYYKRDTTFVLNEDKSDINISTLKAGQLINISKPLVFNVDRIDSYIDKYDLLPTFNTPLVSVRFKNTFNDLKDDIQFVNTLIIDEKNNQNEDYYFMNILNVLPIMDKNTSVFEIKKYGKAEVLKIKSLYIVGLKGHSIVRMAEHKSYIIVTEDFKKRCERANLKGINFIEEG